MDTKFAAFNVHSKNGQADMDDDEDLRHPVNRFRMLSRKITNKDDEDSDDSDAEGFSLDLPISVVSHTSSLTTAVRGDALTTLPQRVTPSSLPSSSERTPSPVLGSRYNDMTLLGMPERVNFDHQSNKRIRCSSNLRERANGQSSGADKGNTCVIKMDEVVKSESCKDSIQVNERNEGVMKIAGDAASSRLEIDLPNDTEKQGGELSGCLRGKVTRQSTSPFPQRQSEPQMQKPEPQLCQEQQYQQAIGEDRGEPEQPACQRPTQNYDHSTPHKQQLNQDPLDSHHQQSQNTRQQECQQEQQEESYPLKRQKQVCTQQHSQDCNQTLSHQQPAPFIEQPQLEEPQRTQKGPLAHQQQPHQPLGHKKSPRGEQSQQLKRQIQQERQVQEHEEGQQEKNRDHHKQQQEQQQDRIPHGTDKEDASGREQGADNFDDMRRNINLKLKEATAGSDKVSALWVDALKDAVDVQTRLLRNDRYVAHEVRIRQLKNYVREVRAMYGLKGRREEGSGEPMEGIEPVG